MQVFHVFSRLPAQGKGTSVQRDETPAPYASSQPRNDARAAKVSSLDSPSLFHFAMLHCLRIAVAAALWCVSFRRPA
jgi:hypothetical protein